MVTSVKKKGDVTEKDLVRFRPEWPQHWNEWVVIHNRYLFDSYDTEEEAKETARLLEKAEKVKNDIIAVAEEKLRELTHEEKKYLRILAGETIKIRIEI